MPTSGERVLLILMIGRLLGWFPGWFWLLQMISPSAFWGKFCFGRALHSKSFSVVFIPLVESKFGEDACSWDKIPG